jgi:hypothetical protein
MTCKINADTTDGLKIVSDTSGAVDFQSNGTTRASIDAAGNLKINSGFGSVATAYGCRAWVNFNGSGTVAIRASGNVSSITDNGTSDYTVNFTTDMPDADYSACISGSTIVGTNGQWAGSVELNTLSIGSVSVKQISVSSDPSNVCVSIFK